MPEIDLLGLLQGRVSVLQSDLDTTAKPVYGVTVGFVSDLKDPQRLGRVKVRLPLLSDVAETGWVRIATPWAGPRRGSYLLPEMGDEVVVAFRHGDLSHPYILGFLWSEKAPPPEPNPLLNRREVRSGKGHLLVFDDTDKQEKVTLRSKGGLEVTLDDGSGQLRISGGGPPPSIRIVVDTQAKTISITAPTGNLSLQAPQGEIALEAMNVRMQASSSLTISGQPVHLNPPVPALPPISPGVA